MGPGSRRLFPLDQMGWPPSSGETSVSFAVGASSALRGLGPSAASWGLERTSRRLGLGSVCPVSPQEGVGSVPVRGCHWVMSLSAWFYFKGT